MQAPTKLTCEYAEFPAGILGNRPRFAWQLSGNEDQEEQTAYRLIISADQENIKNGTGDTADTGFVESGEHMGIRIPGLRLEPHARYYWSVQLKDRTGDTGPFPVPASFITGIGTESWPGKWISRKNQESYKPNEMNLFREYHASYFRKVFHTGSAVTRAVLSVSGIGYGLVTVNGTEPDKRFLDPAQTDYAKRALYSTYDVTPLIQDGDNCIGIVAGNGRHVEEYGYGKPRMSAVLTLRYEDGAIEQVVSDTSWKTAPGPVTRNSIYHGTEIDNRRDMPGWDTPVFTDDNWMEAEEMEGPPLYPQLLPVIKAEREIEPVKMWSPGESKYIFDFGQNMSGAAKITVQGPAGTTLTLRYAELINEDGTLNTVTNRSAGVTDTFICGGRGTETFFPHFTYHGFRYVEVTGYPGVPDTDCIRAVFFYSAVKQAGSFSCSHDLINRLHRNVLWGQKSNLMSVPTDCPQRDERQGWMGDAQLSAEEAVYNFDMYRFYRKYLDDIKDAQLEDGSLSDVIPAYWKRYPADPAWGTAYIVLAWTLYWYYGDEEILNEHFDSMRKYVDFLRSRAEDHILLDLGKYGDWCPPGCIFPKRTPLNLVSTWYYYHDTLFLSRMAGVIGREEDAAEYRKLAGDIKQAFNAQYLTDNGYEYLKMSPIDHIPGQTSNVLPLYLDMAEGKDRELAEAKLMDTVIQHYDYHFDTGIVGTRYILEVLTKLGRGDAAFKMVTRKGFPGFEYMLREGATTLWERWEKLEGPGMNSHNHIMLGSVDAWFYRGILGIIPAEPAWKTIRLTPVFPEELIWAGGSVDTVQGKVSLSWEREDQKLKIKIIIPPGTKGLYSFAGRENRELLPGFHYIEETTEK